MKILQAFWVLLFALPILGCGSSGEDEIRQWMANERAQAKPRITPISEPKQFLPQPYVAEDGIEPFNALKLTQALRRESAQVASNAALIAPEMARRKEPLEAFPLDAMAMVGSMNKNGRAIMVRMTPERKRMRRPMMSPTMPKIGSKRAVLKKPKSMAKKISLSLYAVAVMR